MRLIDAEGLKKSIEEDEELKDNSLAYLLMNLMTCYIDDAPTIDAEPVRHGHWIEKELFVPWCDDDVDISYECSCCETESCWTSPYCPNCGAKMDEVDNT